MLFGFRYLKSGPTEHIIRYSKGKVASEGTGLSFFYFAPSSVIVRVPLSSVDVPFVFNEVSADFQEVTVQGQLTYRVVEPKKVSQMLDYSILPNGRYVSEDPRKLDERLVSLTQVLASAITHRMKLGEVLAAHQPIVAEVTERLKDSPAVSGLGVEVMGVSILSIKPTPETAKALEAAAREALLRQADEAVYARRNAAVAQERLIKESELNTEMAVEEKRRQINEAKMTGSIALEKQRAELIDQRAANERKDADTKAYALNAMLTPIKAVDARTLMALNASKMDPKMSIAMAFRDLADNAEKIGELNITPDLLSALVEEKKK